MHHHHDPKESIPAVPSEGTQKSLRLSVLDPRLHRRGNPGPGPDPGLNPDPGPDPGPNPDPDPGLAALKRNRWPP